MRFVRQQTALHLAVHGNSVTHSFCRSLSMSLTSTQHSVAFIERFAFDNATAALHARVFANWSATIQLVDFGYF